MCSIQGGHPETLAMQNDLAGILLALFVPWETLPSLFDDVMNICGSHRPTGVCDSKHVRNVEIFQKSKDDVDVDIAERQAAASAMQDVFDPGLDDTEGILDESAQING
jgi:hypothetical protein